MENQICRDDLSDFGYENRKPFEKLQLPFPFPFLVK